MKKRIKGFTLIELLATVIILAIVLLIAVPAILNTIENMRKKAFINSVLAFSSSTSRYLDTEVLENGFTYPSTGEYILFDIVNLSLDNGDKYLGNIAILKDENDKTIHLPYITDQKYYVCGVAIEILSTKHIQTKECNFPEEGYTITVIDGIDSNNSIDTDGDQFPDIIEEEYNTDPNDNTSYPDANNTIDTDGDGFSDALEEKHNTDPLDNTNYPSNDVNKQPSIIDYYLKPFDIVKISANEPVLAKGMTPIKWDINGNVVKTTKEDKSWYDYSSTGKRWANAMTEDGSMWVWIPRYAYKISSGYHSEKAGTIDVKFLKETTNNTFTGSRTLPVNQGNNPGSNIYYVTHPAFKFGDDELTGIWLMKFEASSNDGKIQSVPSVKSWRGEIPSTNFNLSRSMETDSTYGWGTTGIGIDTHMMKDVEWGAASYLSWSKYGKNSEVWVNNSSTYITGCAGSSVSASMYTGCQFAYNTVNGQNASTTGNYYGIYDMSGGSYERTAAYLIGAGSQLTTYGASLVAADSKYVDRYIGNSTSDLINYDLNTGYYGNALYETSSQGSSNYSWNSDYSYFADSNFPFIVRGDYYYRPATAGMFNFSHSDGASNTALALSWRTSVVVKNGL